MNKELKSQVRTRIAPSPTGTLHIGTARTALFNFLFAWHNGGKFYLRIEDTDIERSKPEFEKDIIENLKWLGLKWDGEIFKQSQRKNIYAKHIKKLLDESKAFWCYHTKEELEKEKEEQKSRGEAQVHFCEHKEVKSQKSKVKSSNQNSKLNGVIRLKCGDRKIKFHDLIRGEIEFNTNQIGDIVIAKDTQSPLYNFAVVVDDYESKITHVIRGEDHISNTPKQIMIAEALGLPLPQFAHMTLALAPDKSKLSKRHGAVGIGEYRSLGYLPEALVNFMALLGWNPGNDKEIFTLDELIKEFSIERMQKSAAIFNIEKLNWFNGNYIKKMPLEELTKKCVPFLEKENLIKKKMFNRYLIIETGETINFKWLLQIIKLEQERMKKLSEIGELGRFFFVDVPEYEAELLRWKDMTDQEVKDTLDKIYNILSGIKEADFNEKMLEQTLMPKAEETGDRGRLLWPLRAAITGLKASPGPFGLLAVLGKKRALKRLKMAIKKISGKPL